MVEFKSAPQVTAYLDVNQYLQDLYAFFKSQNTPFSYDIWSQTLGFKSRSYLRMVVIGKRSITDQFIKIFCDYMKYDEADRQYFSVLVAYSQCRSHDQKKIYGKKLIDLLKKDVDRVAVDNHYDFLSTPYLPHLQTLLSFDDIEKNVDNLAALLQISKEKVQEGLQKLTAMNLAEEIPGPSSRSWRATQKLLKVPENFGDAAIRNFHDASLKSAIEAQKLSKNLRRYRSLLLPLGSDEFSNYLNELEEFVQQTLFKYKADELSQRRLYQVNFNLFPVSESPEEVPLQQIK